MLHFVPTKGIEPSHPCEWQILSLLRLPIPPHGQIIYKFLDCWSTNLPAGRQVPPHGQLCSWGAILR